MPFYSARGSKVETIFASHSPPFLSALSHPNQFRALRPLPFQAEEEIKFGGNLFPIILSQQTSHHACGDFFRLFLKRIAAHAKIENKIIKKTSERSCRKLFAHRSKGLPPRILPSFTLVSFLHSKLISSLFRFDQQSFFREKS